MEDLGAAIEMLHTYSLIHDDLPALDNDDLRRGKPTCHVVFGEAIAILAGDALQTLALPNDGRPASVRPAADGARLSGLIAEATGTVEGMIGGQVLDLEGEHPKPTAEMRGGDSSREDRRADPREHGGGWRVCGRRLRKMCGG